MRVMLRSTVPDLADLPLQPLENSGTDNQIFRLGSEHCVRLPRVRWASQTAQREVGILRTLDDLTLDVPRPVALGAPAPGYPWQWSVMRWIDGEVVGDTCPGIDDAHRLAGFMSALRAHVPDTAFAYGAANNHRGCPLADRAAPLEKALSNLEGDMDVPALRRIWAMALNAGEAGPPVWLHGDLHGGNLLRRNGKLAAVIDWGLAGVGDGACDLQPAWCLFDGGAREAFRAAIGASEAEWLRGAGWALSVAAIYLAYYRDRGVPTDGSCRTLARLLETFT